MPLFPGSVPALFLAALAIVTTIGAPSARAQVRPEIPSTLDVVGEIVVTGASAALITQPGALVLAVDQSSGQVAGSGPIADPAGHFIITMSKPREFNGTNLTMQLSVNGGVIQLLENNVPVAFPYNGTFPFPTVINKDLTLGVVGAQAPAAPTTPVANICPTWLPRCDVFQTGVVDDRDVEFIKQQLGTRNPDLRADVDGNGVVNTLDLLDEMRALAEIRRGSPLPTATTQSP
jgi:hypothetical protein